MAVCVDIMATQVHRKGKSRIIVVESAVSRANLEEEGLVRCKELAEIRGCFPCYAGFLVRQLQAIQQ